MIRIFTFILHAVAGARAQGLRREVPPKFGGTLPHSHVRRSTLEFYTEALERRARPELGSSRVRGDRLWLRGGWSCARVAWRRSSELGSRFSSSMSSLEGLRSSPQLAEITASSA